MEQRYEHIYSLPSNLYCEKAPLLIKDGTLLKDRQVGRCVVQLSIKNITKKAISSVVVVITPLNAVGQYEGSPIAVQYRDLGIRFEETFTFQQPIVLPVDTAQAVLVRITDVTFANNSTWRSKTETNWEPMTEAVSQAMETDLRENRRFSSCKPLAITALTLTILAVLLAVVVTFLRETTDIVVKQDEPSWDIAIWYAYGDLSNGIIAMVLPLLALMLIKLKDKKPAKILLLVSIGVLGLQALAMLFKELGISLPYDALPDALDALLFGWMQYVNGSRLLIHGRGSAPGDVWLTIIHLVGALCYWAKNILMVIVFAKLSRKTKETKYNQ